MYQLRAARGRMKAISTEPSLTYRGSLFPNANVPERKIPPPVEAICEIEQDRKEKTEERREDKEDRPFDPALEESEAVHASPGHEPEEPPDGLHFQNPKAADRKQVRHSVLG